MPKACPTTPSSISSKEAICWGKGGFQLKQKRKDPPFTTATLGDVPSLGKLPLTSPSIWTRSRQELRVKNSFGLLSSPIPSHTPRRGLGSMASDTQTPEGQPQPNIRGHHLVNSALSLTYFLGEKIEYRFECSGTLENYRPSGVRK